MGQSLLERMRAGSDSTFMQVLIALVMLSFLGFYGNSGRDVNHTIATVNGDRIVDTDYFRTLRNAGRNQEMQLGRTLNDGEQKALEDQVRNALIEDLLVLQEARRLGLEVSDTEVARELLEIQGLRGEDGKFNPELYTSFLKRNQMTQAAFEAKLRENLLREKLRQLVFMGANVSDPAIRDAWVTANTRVDLAFVRIRSGVFDDDATITPDEKTKWLAENAEAVQETYDRDFERLYNHPETVRLRVIRLPIRLDGQSVADLTARLEGLRAEIAAGADFEALARRWSEDPSAAFGGDQGLRPVPQLPAHIATAVAALQPGELSAVVTTAEEVQILRLDERMAAKVDPIDAVRDAIAERLMKAERTPTLAADYAESVHQAWTASGTAPNDLLTAQTLTTANTGPIPTRTNGSPFGPPERMLKDAAKAKVGDVLPEVYEQSGVLWVGKLEAREEADLALYDAQKDQIRDQFLVERRVAFYQDWVAALKASAKIQ